MWPPSWALKWLAPFMSGWVLVGVAAFLGLEVVLMVLAPFMWGWVLVGVAAFLGLEVVLAAFMWGWVLVGVAAFLGLQVVLAPFKKRNGFECTPNHILSLECEPL